MNLTTKYGLVAVLILSCLISCRTLRGDHLSVRSSWQVEFAQAQAIYDSGDFASAYVALQQFQERYAWTPVSLSVLLMTGQSLESLDRAAEAVPFYKRVLEFASETEPGPRELAAEALHRLSFCYETLGDDANVIATLLDLQRRSRDTSKLVVELEVPARLAAAYARLRNFDGAEENFMRADAAFRKMRAQQWRESEKPWLAETLLAMGRAGLSSVQPQALTDQLSNIRQGQKFLIRAMELNMAPSSEAAYRLLTETLSKWVQYVTQIADQGTLYDPFALHELRQTRLNSAKALAVILEDSEESLLPQASPPASMWEAQWRDDLRRFDQTISALLYAQLPDTLLTPEAFEREGFLHKVRLVDPEPTTSRRKKRQTPSTNE